MTKTALLFLLGFLWAVRLSAIKAAGLSGISVFVVVGLSTVGIAILYSAIAIIRHAWPPLNMTTLIFYVASGLLGFIFPFSLETLVAPYLPVFILVVIIATMPIMTLVLSAVTGGHKLSKDATLAVLLGFLGVLFLAGDTALGSQARRIESIWVAIAFGVPALYAANTVFIAKKWPAEADAVQVAHAQALVMSAAIVSGCFASGGISGSTFALTNLPAIFLIIVCEGSALLLYLRIARDKGAVYVSFANYVSMLFAAFIGAYFFGDQLTWQSVLAAVAIVGSIALYNRNAD